MMTVVVPERGFAVTVAPAAFTVARGDSALLAATLERTGGFADPIDVSVAPFPYLPAGITARVTPARVAGANATVVIRAAADAPLGPFPVTVRASIPGPNGVIARAAGVVVARPAARAPRSP